MLTVRAIEVSDAEDIGSAALGGQLAAAGEVWNLASLLDGGGSDGSAGEEGDDDGGELHVGGVGFVGAVLGWSWWFV